MEPNHQVSGDIFVAVFRVVHDMRIPNLKILICFWNFRGVTP